MSFFEYLSANTPYVIAICVVIGVVLIASVVKIYLMRLNFLNKTTSVNDKKESFSTDGKKTEDTKVDDLENKSEDENN